MFYSCFASSVCVSPFLLCDRPYINGVNVLPQLYFFEKCNAGFYLYFSLLFLSHTQGILNNFDNTGSCDLEDDDLMLDVDLPEDGALHNG